MGVVKHPDEHCVASAPHRGLGLSLAQKYKIDRLASIHILEPRAHQISAFI